MSEVTYAKNLPTDYTALNFVAYMQVYGMFTWMSGGCQSDSLTAGERGRGCWETKAAAATTRAERHLEDDTHTQFTMTRLKLVRKKKINKRWMDG